jgi:uncharacterized membrane protein
MAKSSKAADSSKSALSDEDVAASRPSLWRRIRSIHPGLVLATLDLIGLGIALYLSTEELQNHPLICTTTGIFDCNAVAASSYSRPFNGPPVAVYGVFLSLTLFALAIAWWRTNNYKLLLLHYGLSLVGVIFEGWFQFALWVYLHTPNPNSIPVDELD